MILWYNYKFFVFSPLFNEIAVTQLASLKMLMTRGRCIIYRRKLAIKDQERSRKWDAWISWESADLSRITHNPFPWFEDST